MLASIPWTVAIDNSSPDEGATLVVDRAGELIADCGVLGRPQAEQEAHAGFIALAPRMLSALKKAAGHVCGEICSDAHHDIECVAITRVLKEANELVGRGSMEASEPGAERVATVDEGVVDAPRPGSRPEAVAG
jgi:hypothetical protein